MRDSLKHMRALVVDDLALMRDLLRHILLAVGVGRVDTAVDGGEALAAFYRSPADVIFVDWQMDPMSGIEFLQAVRRSVKSPNPYVPIIMVTSHADRRHIIEARDAGVHEYIVKPITAQAVLSRLSTVINNRRPFLRTETFFGPAPRQNLPQIAG